MKCGCGLVNSNINTRCPSCSRENPIPLEYRTSDIHSKVGYAMLDKGKVSTSCEACGAESSTEQQHKQNCIRELTQDGTCFCELNTTPLELQTLEFHGRKLTLCPSCFEKESALLKSSASQLHEYRKNIPDKIEHRVQDEIKTLCTVARWQEVYVTERPNWILANFDSIDDMRDKLTEFMVSMEKLEWETRTRKRAAYDAAKELDARLSRDERDRLVNDPNYKVPDNTEFKKIAKERELDEFIKSMGLSGLKPAQRKAVDTLMKAGMKAEDIKTMLPK